MLLESSLLKVIAAGTVFATLLILYEIYSNLIASPLKSIPGPKLFALTKWCLAYEDYRGTRTKCIQRLHTKYGDAVRLGPTEVSFRSLSALRKIYGAGNGFQRDTFYSMFDVYGRQVMISFASSKDHRERKRILNHPYSKTSVLSSGTASMVEDKTRLFLKLVESEASTSNGYAMEIFAALHYFSMDTISKFVYGKSPIATEALEGSLKDRNLLNDILDPARRKLSWFTIHFPTFTQWLYSQTGILDSLITSLDLLPMRKPATYTGIRAHALGAVQHLNDNDGKVTEHPEESIMNRLWSSRKNNVQGISLDSLDVASECADHLLAGIDTTSDTTMFAMFALSQTKNHSFQKKLRAEILSISEDSIADSVVNPIAADKLVYLDAVIKETLRLYAPLPGTEPRWSEKEELIDGYTIPRGTVVSISPYCLHRNPEVFNDPMRFNPDRWLGPPDEVMNMKKWFWAFSSGGRMCIGMHLAMAEMTTLLASIYRKYETEIAPEFQESSPGVTARYEVFSDEHFSEVKEHQCWVKFVPDLTL
ncbi:hypothetical protein ACLOAV_002450 [Pseudogymnoascus australis]